MPASTITKAFIPRVLGNVTMSQIRTVFAAKQIGKIVNADMHHRKNENNHRYSFVFLDIILYDTKESDDFSEDLAKNGSATIYYDKKNYWEVKSFVSKSERNVAKEKVEEQVKTNKELEEAKEEENLDDIKTLCTDLLVQSYDCNIGWNKLAIHSELLKVCYNREIKNNTCHNYNCGNHSDPNYHSIIFWKSYAFCGEQCQYELESDIRSEWKKHQRKQKQIQQHSKFIPMFNDLKEQEERELKNIRSLCHDLVKRPSSFNAKDLEEMEKEYEDLEKEIEGKLFI